MKTDVKELKTSEISSNVFVIAPSQLDFISSTFADAVAEEMNLKSLSYKLKQIAHTALTKVLNSAKTMGQ